MLFLISIILDIVHCGG